VTANVNVNDLAWLPDRLRSGPIPALNAVLHEKPGLVVSVTADWAMVDYGQWGQLGCPVAELEVAGYACPRCRRRSYNPNDGINGYCGACRDWTRSS